MLSRTTNTPAPGRTLLTIRRIEMLAHGDPVLLQPEGELVRWPRDEEPPRLGDTFQGATVYITRPEHRELIMKMLHGNVLARCAAAAGLPLRMVKGFYSKSQANNLRRVGQRLCPSLRQHVAYLMQHQASVGCGALIKVVSRRSEAGQWEEWSKLQ